MKVLTAEDDVDEILSKPPYRLKKAFHSCWRSRRLVGRRRSKPLSLLAVEIA